MSKQLIFEDLTGGINNVDTKGLLNSTTKKTQSPEMVNVEYFKLGGIKSMEGNTQVGNVQDTAIVGGWEYTHNNKRDMIIGTQDGTVSIYNKTTNEFDNIYKFPNNSDRMSFCNINNGFVTTNGKDDLLFYDANSSKTFDGYISEYSNNTTTNKSTLTGVNTEFTKDLRVNQFIYINDCYGKYKIEEIISDTSIIVSPIIQLNEGQSYYGWSGDEQQYTISTTKNSQLDILSIDNNSINNGTYTFLNYGNGKNKIQSHYYLTLNKTANSTLLINGLIYDENRHPINTNNGQLVNWTDVSVFFGICDGKLYWIGDATNSVPPTLLDDGGTWTSVYNQIGIRDGKLYYLQEGGITLIDEQGTWTKLPDKYDAITNFSNTSKPSYIYGVRNGLLYSIVLQNTNNVVSAVTTQVTHSSFSPNGFTCISSQSLHATSSGYTSRYAYVINSGRLFKLDGNTATQIGTDNAWTKVCGFNDVDSINNGIFNAVALNGNVAYKINRDNSLSLLNSNASDICGMIMSIQYTSTSVDAGCAIATSDGVYIYYNSTNEKISNNKPTTIFGSNVKKVSNGVTNNYYESFGIYNDIIYRFGGELIDTPYFYNGNNWYINSYSYNNKINLSTYNLICNTLVIGDVVTLTKNNNNINVYTNILSFDPSINNGRIYYGTYASSELSNVVYKSTSNNILKYKTNNSGLIKYNTCQRNNNIDYYNDDESVSFNNERYSFSGIELIPTQVIDTRSQEDLNDGEELLEEPVNFKGLAIQYYAGRLWIGGTDDDGNGILVYSAVGLPNNFDLQSDAGYIVDLYNDSSPVLALGLFSEFMTIHKEFNTYLLTCTGETSTIEIKPFSNITCKSQQSWIVSNTKYFVYSDDFNDIYPLVQHTVWNDRFLGEPISQKMRNIFSEVRLFDTDEIFCVSRPLARQMLFYMPTNNHAGSNYAVIYDFQTKSWLLRVVPQEVTIAFNYNNNIYIGTANGKVLKEFTGDTFDGQPIVAYYKSPWFDWLGGYFQSFAEFEIEIDSSYNNDFYIRTQKNGQSRYEDRNITNNLLQGSALIWGGIDDFNNTTTWDNDKWVRQTFENIRMLLPNNVFEDFQIEIGTNKLGQGFAIYGYKFRRIEAEECPW